MPGVPQISQQDHERAGFGGAARARGAFQESWVCDLLQSAPVFINTLLVQSVLKDEKWEARLTSADKRGLSPLFWSNANLYGTIDIQMDRHLDLGLAA